MKRLHKTTGKSPNPKCKKSSDGKGDDIENKQHQRRRVINRSLSFQTDSTSSIGEESLLKSDLTDKHGKYTDSEPLPLNSNAENNFVNNCNKLATPLTNTNMRASLPKGYFGLTMGPLTNYVLPPHQAFQLQTSMTPSVVCAYPCSWPRQPDSIVPRTSQIPASSAQQVKSLTVIIESKTGFKETTKLNGTRNGIGFSLLKGSDDDVAKAIMKDNSIKQSCITNLLAELKDQCRELCR